MTHLRPKQVLIYQIGSLGDTLVSLPAYRAIRRHVGADAQIHVVHNVPPDGRATPHQVLSGPGLVDSFIGFRQQGERSTWRTMTGLWPRIARLRAEAVYYLAPAERSPTAVRRDRLFFRACGVLRTLGFHSYDPALFHARDSAGRPTPLPHEAEMRLDRLRRSGVAICASDLDPPFITLSPQEQETVWTWVAERQRYPGRALVAICPGANQPAKFWPLERFAEIGRRLMRAGYEPLVIGGALERVAGEELLARWDGGINAAGQFSVSGSAALLSGCRFLIGLDTGTTHLAAAIGTPCVALYADRDPPGQWFPLGPGHTVLRKPVPCGGCRLRVCDQAGHPCMGGITVDEVWAAARPLMEGTDRVSFDLIPAGSV